MPATTQYKHGDSTYAILRKILAVLGGGCTPCGTTENTVLHRILDQLNAAEAGADPGAVFFGSAAGNRAWDADNLFWDAAAKQLDIGAGTPGATLDVNGDILTIDLEVTGDLTTGLTPGSIPFIGVAGLLTEDNSNLFYDSANVRIGLGTNAPAAKFHAVLSSIDTDGILLDGDTNPLDVAELGPFSTASLIQNIRTATGTIPNSITGEIGVAGIVNSITPTYSYNDDWLICQDLITGMVNTVSDTRDLVTTGSNGFSEYCYLVGIENTVKRDGDINMPTLGGENARFQYGIRNYVTGASRVTDPTVGLISSTTGLFVSASESSTTTVGGGILLTKATGIDVVVGHAGYSPVGGTTYGLKFSEILSSQQNVYCIHIAGTIQTTYSGGKVYPLYVTKGDYSYHKPLFGINKDAATAMLDAVASASTNVVGRFKGAVSQSANLLECRTSGDAILFAIGSAGSIRTSQSSAATTPGSVTKKLPLYDVAGTLLGYVPIYDAIT